MSWKNWPSWLKGGVVGGGIVAGIWIIYFIKILLDVIYSRGSDMLILALMVIPLWGIFYTAIAFGVGVLIGFIIGKIKFRRKNKK